jgi:hypothetical protein
MGEHAGFGLRTRERGKHRTEVSEVTEGGGCSMKCAWGNTAASVGEYEEAPGPRTLDAAEKKYLLLISTDLIGLKHIYADSHIRQIPIANS